MKWFRRKKEPEVIHHIYDILPPFDWETATSETAKEFFKGLTRIQILEIYDREDIPDQFWEEYYEVKNEMSNWPVDEDISTAMNKLYWNSDSLYKRNQDILKQIDGMQKKLDRVSKILEKSEICMSGKTAMEL